MTVLNVRHPQAVKHFTIKAIINILGEFCFIEPSIAETVKGTNAIPLVVNNFPQKNLKWKT
jgi:hypothetical protein